jgi:hypothetical protein
MDIARCLSSYCFVASLCVSLGYTSLSLLNIRRDGDSKCNPVQIGCVALSARTKSEAETACCMSDFRFTWPRV